jgi:hypothetical protein
MTSEQQPPVENSYYFLVPSGVNFINIIREAFTRADPKSVKIYRQCNWIFTLLGSVSIKSAHRTLMNWPQDDYWIIFMGYLTQFGVLDLDLR